MTFAVAKILRQSGERDVLVIGAGTARESRRVFLSLTEPKVFMA